MLNSTDLSFVRLQKSAFNTEILLKIRSLPLFCVQNWGRKARPLVSHDLLRSTEISEKFSKAGNALLPKGSRQQGFIGFIINKSENMYVWINFLACTQSAQPKEN